MWQIAPAFILRIIGSNVRRESFLGKPQKRLLWFSLTLRSLLPCVKKFACGFKNEIYIYIKIRINIYNFTSIFTNHINS